MGVGLLWAMLCSGVLYALIDLDSLRCSLNLQGHNLIQMFGYGLDQVTVIDFPFKFQNKN